MQPYPFESKIRLENGRTRCWRNLEVWTHQEKKSQNRNGVCTHFDFPFFQKIKCREIELLLELFLVKLLGPKVNSRGELKKKNQNQNRVEPGFELERGLKRKKKILCKKNYVDLL